MTADSHKFLVIHNPTAGRRRAQKLAAVMEGLKARGHGVEMRATQAAGDAERLCRTLDLAGFTRVVIAGGDGTLNEAANGLLARTGETDVPPLAVIPVGTANVLAAEMRLRRRADAIVDYLENGIGMAVCPGILNGRVFLVMASVGFDSWVVSTVSKTLKKRFGMGAYIARAIAGLFTYRAPQIDVETPELETKASTVVVMNGRLYGGPFVMAPGGDLKVAGFKVCLLTESGVGRLIGCAFDVLFGRLDRNPHVKWLTTKQIRLSGPGSAVQADGDIVAHLPVEIAACGKTLDILYPPQQAS